MSEPVRGPLQGLRIVEIAGLGPTPFAAMTLADMGAEVLRIAPPGAVDLIPQETDILNRGRDWVELDLKSTDGAETARHLIAAANPHMSQRKIFGPHGPAAAPRLSATPGSARAQPAARDAADMLARWQRPPP